MSRLLAYVGPEIRLDQLILTPSHGLLNQALNSQRQYADGYGIAWYDAEGIPALYSNRLPIWADTNLPGLARSLYGDLWLATVARADQPFAAEMIQLFADDQLVFLHDGRLSDFSALYCTARDFLDPEIAAEIHSNSDSEYIFALLRHLLSDDAELSIEEALWELLALLDEWLEERAGLLNIVVGDGERIYAVRHAHNSECAPLYYSIDDEDFPDGRLLASERLTETEFWLSVPKHHLLILDPEEPPELLAL